MASNEIPTRNGDVDFSDDDDASDHLPQFTHQSPYILQLDLNDVEAMEKYLEDLDLDQPSALIRSHSEAPASCLSFSDIETLQQNVQKASKQSMECLQRLKKENEQLSLTATKCKKSISKSLEARREATEAMKQLNAETQHVLDDEVDDKWLASVEQTLYKTAKNFNQAFNQTDSITVKNGALNMKSGFQLEKEGDDLKVTFHDSQNPSESYYVQLQTDCDQKFSVVSCSHEISSLQEMVNDLNLSSDWPKFYMKLRKCFLGDETTPINESSDSISSSEKHTPQSPP